MIFLDSSAAIHLMRGELPDAPLRGETLVLSVLVEMEHMLAVRLKV